MFKETKRLCCVAGSLNCATHKFSVFINDLATIINEAGLGVSVNATIISCFFLLYADDIAFVAPDPKSLQSMLDIISEWCRLLGLVINT